MSTQIEEIAEYDARMRKGTVAHACPVCSEPCSYDTHHCRVPVSVVCCHCPGQYRNIVVHPPDTASLQWQRLQWAQDIYNENVRILKPDTQWAKGIAQNENVKVPFVKADWTNSATCPACGRRWSRDAMCRHCPPMEIVVLEKPPRQCSICHQPIIDGRCPCVT